MRDEHEVRMVVQDGKLTLVHPPSDRKVPTGVKIQGSTDQKQRQLEQVAEQLKRSGNRVSVREV